MDEHQEEVIEYPGSCAVIAGPGSGKTRVLAGKAQKLWDRGEDIVCLTFTRAAAQELRDRMPGVRAQTIHSYCYWKTGWVGNYDKLIYAYLSSKDREQFGWVLVDEVQDLTELEFEVVKSLVGDKLFVVGDPYQSIYGWNGALGKEVFNEVKDLKQFKLVYNYRSDERIVKWLNRIYPRGLESRGIKETGITAVLSRTNKGVSEAVKYLLRAEVPLTLRYREDDDTIEEDYGSRQLQVMTCHCSKGLEFDNVIVYKWLPEPSWGEELNVYYVSVARASKNFCNVGSEYQLLKEIERVKK